VLLPCSDELVLEVASLDPEIAERFPAFVPPLSALEILIDKGRFYELLASLGVPHPVTHVGSDSAELEPLFADHEGPLFLKPRFSHKLLSQLGVKGLRPRGREEFRIAAKKLESRGIEFVVQEYVPGPASNHYFLDGFVDPQGRMVARFARQRLRMFPTDFGNSSLMVSVPVQALGEAVEQVEGLLGTLNYRGIFSVEFKKDPRDGVFRILEVNARPWWYIEFAARCGVDVASMAYRSAMGDTVAPVASYRVGQKLMYPYFDFFSCRAENLSFPRAVVRFLTPLATAHQPIFSWDDPWPGLTSAVATLSGSVKRRITDRSGESRS
jgi:predicted ATP-grasp superfamily ATP-dependent carboligase